MAPRGAGDAEWIIEVLIVGTAAPNWEFGTTVPVPKFVMMLSAVAKGRSSTAVTWMVVRGDVAVGQSVVNRDGQRAINRAWVVARVAEEDVAERVLIIRQTGITLQCQHAGRRVVARCDDPGRGADPSRDKRSFAWWFVIVTAAECTDRIVVGVGDLRRQYADSAVLGVIYCLRRGWPWSGTTVCTLST